MPLTLHVKWLSICDKYVVFLLTFSHIAHIYPLVCLGLDIHCLTSCRIKVFIDRSGELLRISNRQLFKNVLNKILSSIKYTSDNQPQITYKGPEWYPSMTSYLLIQPKNRHCMGTLQVTDALGSLVGLPDVSIMSTVYTTTFPFSMTWSCSGETCMDTGSPATTHNHTSWSIDQ